jgi:hypothetical protein
MVCKILGLIGIQAAKHPSATSMALFETGISKPPELATLCNLIIKKFQLGSI